MMATSAVHTYTDKEVRAETLLVFFKTTLFLFLKNGICIFMKWKQKRKSEGLVQS